VCKSGKVALFIAECWASKEQEVGLCWSQWQHSQGKCCDALFVLCRAGFLGWYQPNCRAR